MELAAARTALEGDHSLVGRSLCRAYSDLIDGWLAGLVADAEAECGSGGVALVAAGGYGRAELSLQSDIDVLLVHTGRSDIGTLADRLWYPIWDEGLKLGHSVRTMREALNLAAEDLDTATSLLQVRHLAGDPDLTDDLARRALEQWQKRAKRWLDELSRRVRSRHEAAGEVAFLLEPDLKEGRGGLRDVHGLHWAEAARRLLWEGDNTVLEEAYDALLSARVELHRRTGRPGDRLLLEEQDGVAAALGDESADELMHRLSAAARTIAWRSDDAWHRIDASLSGPTGWRSRSDKSIGDGLVLRDGEVHLTAEADPGADPGLPLRAGAAGRGRGHAHPPLLARPAGGTGRSDPRALVARGALRPRRPAARGPPRHPGGGSTRPDGPVGAGAARVGGGAQQAPAERLPPLHRRPAPDGGVRQRRRSRGAHRSAGSARAGRAAARHRQGLPGGPHRRRDRAARDDRAPHGLRALGRGRPPGDGAPPPAAPRRRDPAGPR